MRRPALLLTLLVALLLAVRPTASAQEPTLEFTPAFGSCEQPMLVVGRGFPAGVAVAIGVPGMTEFSELATTTADANGVFRVELPATFPASCTPGRLLGVAAIAEPDTGRVFRVAEYEVASPWRLEILSCEDGRAMHARGRGFPPNERITLWLTGDTFVAHSIAEAGRVVSDSRGAFDQIISPAACPGPSATVIALLAEADHSLTQWTARANSTVPSPASTGHGVEGQRSRFPLELALVVITVVLLLGGRSVGRFR